MKKEDFLDEIAHIDNEAEILVSILDENCSEKLVSFKMVSACEGSPVIDLTELMAEIAFKAHQNTIQACIDRVPKELQTEENLKLICIMFDIKKGE